MESGGEAMVWCDIDLEVVGPYRKWKQESVDWAMTVNWALVNDLVRQNFSDLPTDDDLAAVRAADAVGLSGPDREGLFSLYAEPIWAFPGQVSAGGHRILAMRAQKVRWALGQCFLDQVGDGVDELHAYVL
jgi:hypothetical protein